MLSVSQKIIAIFYRYANLKSSFTCSFNLEYLLSYFKFRKKLLWRTTCKKIFSMAYQLQIFSVWRTSCKFFSQNFIAFHFVKITFLKVTLHFNFKFPKLWLRSVTALILFVTMKPLREFCRQYLRQL